MSRPRFAALLAVLVAAVVTATSCTGAGDERQREDETESPSPTAADVSTTVTYLDQDVTITIHPLQVQGGRALLTADFALPASATSPLPLATMFRDPSAFLNAGQVRLLDLPAGHVHLVGASGGRFAATTLRSNLEPGETATIQAFFAPPDSATVGVLLPWFGLVPDVPVEQATTLATSPEQLGMTGEADYVTAPIDAFTVAYDEGASSRVEGDEARVALSSDVLFATGKHALTATARQVVDEAAAQIRATGSAGRVEVVGHTDDVGSDAFNLTLSNRRADAVAARLRPALGADFTVVTAGKGETQPAVAGTSAAARKANRRVEIAFTTRTAGAAVHAPSTAPAPAAAGPVGSGSSPVAVELDGVSYDVTATRVVRRAGFLVGTLTVTRTSAGAGNLVGLFGDYATGLSLGRGLGALTMAAGAFDVTLLGQGARVYPSDYVVPGTSSVQRAIVADRFLDQPVGQGQSVDVTVVWPDTGTDAVDIDVPDRFRITGVTVTS